MAKIPPILYVSAAAQLFPALAWAASRRRTRAAAAIAIGGVIGVLGDIVGRMLAAKYHNNHIATYIDAPTIAICFLYALREWQVTGKERKYLSIGGILLLVGCILLVAFVEDIGNFNLGVSPLTALVLLAAAIWTLLRNSMVIEQTPLHANDWFWATLGLALQSAATALASPIGGMMLAKDQIDLFVIVWQVRAGAVITSYCLIGWGIYRGPVVSRFSTV